MKQSSTSAAAPGGGSGAGEGGGGRAAAASGSRSRAGAGAGAGAGGGAGGGTGVGGGAGGGPASAAPSSRAALGGWLEGPRIESGQDEWAYRGQRLGLPESGPGSLAPQGRRFGALLVDWAIAVLIAKSLGLHPSSQSGGLAVLGIFAAEHVLLLSTLGYTIGKRIFGTRVGRLGGSLTPLSVLVRTALLIVVVPAVIWDRDGRGLHDKVARTIEVLR